MKILGYQGKSFISYIIKIATKSKYSHVAIWVDETIVIESWAPLGVTVSNYPCNNHKIGTPIDIFDIPIDYDEKKVRNYLEKQIGKPYDYYSIFRFALHYLLGLPLRRKKDGALFCNELIEEAFDGKLLDGPPSSHTPGELLNTLIKTGTMKC